MSWAVPLKPGGDMLRRSQNHYEKGLKLPEEAKGLASRGDREMVTADSFMRNGGVLLWRVVFCNQNWRILFAFVLGPFRKYK